MSTPTTHRGIEERLTAALHARADQVTPDDLTALLVPRPHRSRRPHRRAVIAVAAAAAAAAAVVVALPLVGGDGGGEEPQPAPAPTPTPSLVEQGRDEIRVDLDGDGQVDRVWIDGETFNVEVGSGTSAGADVPRGTRLLPAVTDAGTRHPLVVAVPPAGSEARAVVATYRDDRTVVFDEAPVSLAAAPGSTVWVDDIGALMVGEYDPDVPEDQRVSVAATVYRAAGNGKLVEYGAGDLCWDRVTNAYPVDCSQLPAQKADPSLMFPMVEERYPVGTSHGAFDGEYNNVVLRRAGDGYEIVYTWDGVTSRAPVADGGTPELMGSAIGSSQDAPALVVAQESGDSTAMTVFAPTSEGFRALDVPDGRFLGSGPGAGPDHLAQRTWMSQQSGLWTAHQVSEDEPDRYEVTRWTVDDTRLVADEQGRACLDFTIDQRLPDATCGAS